MKVASIAELYESREYCMALIDHEPWLWHLLQSVGDWRGLFDFAAHEFKQQGSIEEKWFVVERLKEFLECGFDGLIYLFALDCNQEHRAYILHDIPYAVHAYSENYREAEMYLMNCHHPIFQRFAKNLTKHWKVATRANIVFRPKPVSNESLLELLTDSVPPAPSVFRKWESESYDVACPIGWSPEDHVGFIERFIDSLSAEDRKWEGCMGGGPSKTNKPFPLAITPKLAVAMKQAGYKLIEQL